MKLSIIIPVYNNWNFTRAALKDLAKLPADHEVILIDNGSTDNTHKSCYLWTHPFIMVDQIHADHPSNLDLPKKIRVIQNKENLGFAKASNQGYEIAQGEYILFLNNDIRVQKEYETWTQKLIDAASDGLIVGPNGGLLDAHFNFMRETTTIEKGNFYMSGWCLCAKKEIFNKFILPENEFKGPFTEEFKTYFEDTDLGYRATELGIPFKIVPVPVFHFGKTTSTKLGISNLYLPAKAKFITKWTKRKNA